MLLAESTKYKAGVAIYGDYFDFQSLHSTVESLTERSPLNGVSQGFTLGVAQEFQRAYECRREVKHFSVPLWDPIIHYARIQLPWPNALVFCGLLRWAASFNPTSKSQQADLFRLETALEEALLKANARVGKEVIAWLEAFRGLPEDYLFEFIQYSYVKYVTENARGLQRFKSLPIILWQLSTFSDEYKKFAKRVQQVARFQKTSPQNINVVAEWPDFEW